MGTRAPLRVRHYTMEPERGVTKRFGQAAVVSVALAEELPTPARPPLPEKKNAVYTFTQPRGSPASRPPTHQPLYHLT